MGTGMPELGSKISLISKADIRYEGRLFTVDPQECTIALAAVRSFGTEDRETQCPVPAQNQVYDYILFRGSDIKDIRIVNTPSLPNDPAIMQLSVPPSLGQQHFHTQGFSHPVLGPMGPQLGQFSSGYGALGMMESMGSIPKNLAPGMNRDFRGMQNSKPSELITSGTAAPPSEFSPAIEPTRQSDHASVLDLIGGGSRSTTPVSLSSRKSPTADQGVQTGGAKKGDKMTVKPIQPPTHRNQQRPRKDSRGEVGPSHQDQQYQRPQNRQPSRGQQHNQGQRQHQQQLQGGWGQMSKMPMQQRSRGRGRGSQNNYRNVQSNQQGNNKPKSTLKFENDYDFEQANTQFEELKIQLEKLKIKDGKEMNGDLEKKDDSGNETGAGEGEQEDESQMVYYNKSISFFDNISCEAVERSKGRSQRTDWRAERKLNSETFGVASTRRNNNYFRGRTGGYYNRGFRGSYRGGYRNTGNRKGGPENNRTTPNQSQNQNQNKQQQQQQQPTTNTSRGGGSSSTNPSVAVPLPLTASKP